jgi:chromosome segregation ATPase
MPPSKRKAQESKPKVVEKAAKKPKVEDPVDAAITKLSNAINFDLAPELPHKAVTMVLAVIPEALYNPVEDRSELETKFGQLVGEALTTAQKSLDEKVAWKAEKLEEKVAKVDELAKALEKANETKNECDEKVEQATTAEREAKEAKNTANEALTTQQDEEAKLPEKKNQLDTTHANLVEAIAIAEGDVPSAKEAKKLNAQLKEVGAPESLVLGMAAAVGKTGDFEKMFISQSVKLLDTKKTEIEGEQTEWATHTENMATKTKELETEAEKLTAAHEERTSELAERKKELKTAIQGVKDAELQQKNGNKALEKATKENDEATKAVDDCKGFYTTYEYLLERTLIEPPKPEEPAEEVPEPVADEPTAEEPKAEEEPKAAEAVTEDAPMEEPKMGDAPMEEPKMTDAPWKMEAEDAPMEEPVIATPMQMEAC